MRIDIPPWQSRPVRSDPRFEASEAHPGAAPRRPRVLLLTSGLGLGHVRAAQAIEAALRETAHVRTLDFWSLVNPGAAAAHPWTYLSLVQNYPALWERLYRLDEHTWRQILESEIRPAARSARSVRAHLGARGAKADESVPRGGRYASDKMLFSLLCAAFRLTATASPATAFVRDWR